MHACGQDCVFSVSETLTLKGLKGGEAEGERGDRRRGGGREGLHAEALFPCGLPVSVMYTPMHLPMHF